jgi:hypothetical protein
MKQNDHRTSRVCELFLAKYNSSIGAANAKASDCRLIASVFKGIVDKTAKLAIGQTDENKQNAI